MKLSLSAEYALLSLIHLTRHDDCECSKLEAISASQGIPAELLKEILGVLVAARYIDKAKGGYHLIPGAEKISVAEVMRLFDGALAPYEPISEKGFEAAPMDNERKLSDLFESIQADITTRLERTSIADIT